MIRRRAETTGPGRVRPALEAALEGLDPACELTVLCNDPQRATRSDMVLAALTERAPGVRHRLLVATGSHATDAPARARFERRLNPDGRFEVAWHDCRGGNLVAIGPCWRGHPWLLDDRPVLAVGSVEMHYFAGLTGAHKTATIGVASHEAIEANHATALWSEARPGRLAGNPVFEGIEAMLRDLESQAIVSAVNLLQEGDEVVNAAGGTPLAALGALRWEANRRFLRSIETPADLLVAHVPGVLGETFYQADKGIKNTEWAVRDGGALVLDAPCRRGLGPAAFTELMAEAPTHAEALAVVSRRGYRLGDHKAVRLRRLTDPACRGVRVWVVAEGLGDSQAAMLGLHRAAAVREAVAQAEDWLGEARARRLDVDDAGNRCVVVDEGPAPGP